MSKAKLIAAMPVGSKWTASQYFADNPGAVKDMGHREVSRHRTKFMELYRNGTMLVSCLDYPKRTDILTVSDDGNTVKIEYFKDGKLWTTVTYIHLK